MNDQPLRLDTNRLNSSAESASTPVSPEATLPTPPAPELLSPDQIQEIEKKAVDVLQTCYDPEIPVNIYELGLIYNIDVQPTGLVHVRMTLTSPACPAAGSLPPEVRWKVQEIPGVKDAKVEIVWDPPWTKERMSEAARLQLGIFD